VGQPGLLGDYHRGEIMRIGGVVLLWKPAGAASHRCGYPPLVEASVPALRQILRLLRHLSLRGVPICSPDCRPVESHAQNSLTPV
jgi:hypothetical protein